MRIGLQIPSFTWPGGPVEISKRLGEIARTADLAGFASLWTMDHFFQIRGVGQPDEPMLEGYSTLSYLAAVTRQVRLGTMVTGVVYRHPGILVKTVTTLDVLSGGRAYFGVGAAWNEAESRGLGVPFPPVAERFERLEETLQIALQMWSGNAAAYQGKHFHLEQTLCSPQPTSQPHPPILIGGMGEKKTLRLVAKYGDACNLFVRAGIDTVRAKLDILRRHCEEVGRNYDEIERTGLDVFNLAPGQMSTTQVVDYCGKLAEIGIQQIIVSLPDVSEIRPIELIGQDVIPAITGM
jgi:F420-dependent oxidoreductase-like protein